jgi:hypothetical protein
VAQIGQPGVCKLGIAARTAVPTSDANQFGLQPAIRVPVPAAHPPVVPKTGVPLRALYAVMLGGVRFWSQGQKRGSVQGESDGIREFAQSHAAGDCGLVINPTSAPAREDIKSTGPSRARSFLSEGSRS